MTTPTIASVDTARLASQLRLGVTRLARKLRQETGSGLTPSLLSALATIGRNEPLTLGDLADAERIRRSSVTRIVAALVEADLVARGSDPSDRRTSWIRLTPQGRKLLERSRSRKDAYLATRLRSLDPAQVEVLERAIEIFEQMLAEEK
jgi:DNA-binding MarR family transcriptional regulator